MPEMVNPYIAGAPVTERTMFFGREDIFDWVQRCLTGKFVDHILVVHGQRRVGKTSVLKQIPFHLSPTYIPVFFDLQGRTHTSIDRFLWRLAKEITRTVRTTKNIYLAEPLREDFSQDPEFFQNQFLPQLSDAMGDRRLLLIFDEFDSLEEPTAREMLAQDLIPYLSRLMHAPGPLAFIFSIGSSGRKLEHMQASYTDFFRIALYRKISSLEKEQAFRLITQPVAGVIEYEPQAVENIYQITSGHPYFTQLLCHELFSYCQKIGKRRIAPEDVEAVLDDVVERGTVNLKFVWDDASDPERYVLTALSLSEDGRDAESIHRFLQGRKVRVTQREVTDSLRHLQEKDVLAPDNSFTVDLMRLWLLENKPLERVIEELIEVSPIAARFIEIAEEFHETGVAEEALNNYRRALEVDPQNLTAQVGIASLIFEQGDLPQAAQEYEKALQIDPEDIATRSGLCQTHLTLGDQLREKGQIEEALEHYRRILAINEQHLEAQERLAAYEELAEMYRRAQSALSEKRYDQALRLFREIVSRDVRYRDATRLLAQAVQLQRGAKPLWKDIRVLGGAGGFIAVVIIAVFLLRLPSSLIPGTASPVETPSAVASAVLSGTATAIPTPLTSTPPPVVETGSATPTPRPPTPTVTPTATSVPPGELLGDMILVPAGEFTMGGEGYEAHHVYLDSFYIGKYEVTNSQYKRFVEATGHEAPQHWPGGAIPEGKENHPVVWVNWYDSRAYCQWLADQTGQVVRLPTEAEWEKAARGTDGRMYPWGNEFDKDKCNTGESGIRDTTPVGTYSPEGDSPYGVADMTGNVYEWTSSLNADYPYSADDGREDPEASGNRVLRGGSFSLTLDHALTNRVRGLPDSRSRHMGFRVVVSPPPVVEAGTATPTLRPSTPSVASGDLLGDMMLIPAGEFVMGSAEGVDDQKPPHEVYLDAFYIGKYPITNLQYKRFVEATGHEAPQHWPGGAIPEGGENHPVVYVNWYAARAYCEWLADQTGQVARLPTEAEWEKAARGTDGRIYPWGNEFDKDKCNTGESGFRHTTPVDWYSPEGDSPYGVADMAGNVWQWTSSLYEDYPYNAHDGREDPEARGNRVLRGGAYNDDRRRVRCAFRVGVETDYRSSHVGFRVVVSPGSP